MRGKKKGQNNSDTVWSQVLYAITQSQEVHEENTACSMVDGCVSTGSPIVLSQNHVSISGKKTNTRSKMLLFGGRKENLGTTFTKPKLRFSNLALHSRKQKNKCPRTHQRKLDIDVSQEKSVWHWQYLFCRINILLQPNAN